MKNVKMGIGLLLALIAVIMWQIPALSQSTLTWEGVLPHIYTGSTGDYALNIAMTASTVGLDVSEVSALTNAVNPTIISTHTTSGTPANGIGNGYSVIQETSAGNNETIMELNGVVTDVTAGSEDAKFSVELMAAGAAAAEKFSVTSTGVVTLVNGETIDNTVNGTVTYTATTHAFAGNVSSTGSIDAAGAGGIILQNDETITNAVNGVISVDGAVDITAAGGLILSNDETITNAVDGTVLVTAPIFATSAALKMTFVVADPCGAYPEGAIFYNDTANVPCFCDQAGDDLKIADGAACF